MSSVIPVPELAATAIGRLTARDVWLAVRHYGLLPLARESFVRFRYGDGFSHARALGLQLSVAAIPLVIAAIGLANALRTDSLGLVLRRTLLELTPRASDELVRSTISPFRDDVGEHLVALVLGLAAALLALTTAMGQVERGANRIYGISRDRPTVAKYRRAFGMALIAGLPIMVGSGVLVAAEAFAEAVELVYGLQDDVVAIPARILGAVLLLAAITLVLRRSPARRQPGWSLLALGGLVALVMSVALTGLLAGFLHLAADVGSVYGPVTVVMALLLWAQLTSAAVFLGFAVSAQVENARVGREEAAKPGAGRALPEPEDLARLAALDDDGRRPERT